MKPTMKLSFAFTLLLISIPASCQTENKAAMQAPRDRSLVTVSALIASGQVAQVGYHLNRAMDNGLTQTQASEVLKQLAFYAGWPNVFSALPVVKEVFDKHAQ